MRCDELRLTGSGGANRVMEAETKRLVMRSPFHVRVPNPKREGDGTLLYPFDPQIAWVVACYHRTSSRVSWDLFSSRAVRLEPLFEELRPALEADDRLPVAPELRFSVDMLFIPRDVWSVVRADGQLWRALVVSTLFWLVAAIVQPAVNALGKLQLLEDNRWTSLLVMVISAGIAAGSVLAGWFSRQSFQPWVPRVGAWGMVICLLLLAIPVGDKQHLLGYWGSVTALILLGGFTGLFAVPLNVFLQSRPPAGLKGRTIATQNLLNWVGIFVSTGIYWAANSLLEVLHWPNNGLFALTALLMLPIALAYRPQPA